MYIYVYIYTYIIYTYIYFKQNFSCIPDSNLPLHSSKHLLYNSVLNFIKEIKSKTQRYREIKIN